MKIAVASDKSRVAGHFGHCEGFHIFHIESNDIIKVEIIANPGHRPGFLPNFLNDAGVNVVISGGLGGGAIDIFSEKGIKVVTGASGSSEEVVRAYINGDLKSAVTVCKEHMHQGDCGH